MVNIINNTIINILRQIGKYQEQMKYNHIPKYLKDVTSRVATVLSLDNKGSTTYPCVIANNFNKYFACIEALLIFLPLSV